MDDRPGVRATYERIADHFAETREYPWPEVESFCADRHVVTALDVGCGNGRHTELLGAHADHVIGIDASGRLLALARERAPNAAFLEADAAALPLADGVVDLAVYVATLHHLPSRELRRQSLDELARVLDESGTALVSAWSTAHDRFDADEDAEDGFDTDVEWTLPGGETVPRFYHIYAPAEFDTDIAESDLTAVDSFVSSGNCYAVVEAA
ncbi:probable S-adenosylmethionine-dependent methyltransferase [Natronomonas pharaonis DSM 2160]|uniref:Probable S-adenosylmethionine-dependent methyltransferase n=1 Tax=Natronomonas pharaonis (strain ATCC 35678 / DSM 2160 / CIP 103997 / JCM 8858 / NBRC 14720 / NCIMB 2260 / Gabara) TaxID=348780 RepID=A0A1U7EX19_NATPD|nr:class I SAM-dependent methyltransferase [Natronomonas pharaonis]CAI49646.1 probable S-adenosylmethionine-dependent methyltransferase [Natronomonas pharaonis DSM 2160]